MSRTATPRSSKTAPLLAFMVLLTSMAFPLVAADAAPDETFADDFQSFDFNGSTGSRLWAGPWVEHGESDGPGAGAIQVNNEPHCATEPCLLLGRTGHTDTSVDRELDLSQFATATLTFDYKIHAHNPGKGQASLAMSDDGGTNWYLLDIWELDTDTGPLSASYDITQYMAPNTKVEFVVVDNTDESHMNVDNLAVEVTYWAQQTTPTNDDLYAIQFPVNEQTGYAAGDTGTMLKTTDGGDTWVAQATPTFNSIRGLDFPTDTLTGYAVGTNDTILKTTNGTDWVAQSTPTDTNLLGVDFVDLLTGYAVGDSGTILKTTDGGQTWMSKPSGTTKRLYDVAFPGDDQTGFAAGQDGTILKTTDGGDSWLPQVSGVSDDINGIQFPVDSNNGYAVATGGVLLATTDGGTSWQTQTTPNGDDLHALHFPQDAQHGHVATEKGGVISTDSGGSGWVLEPVPTPEDLFGIWFTSLTRGWVVGRSGVILVTGSSGVVPAANNPPSFAADLGDRTDSEGTPILMSAAATDPDAGTSLVYSATGLPEGISMDPDTGAIAGALGPNAAGTHNVTLTVTDDGTPNLQDSDTFTWTVTQGEVTYLIADSGGANGGDDLLTVVDRSDGNPITNETSIGTGTGTTNIAAAALQPGTNILFAVNGDQLGTVDVTTGVFAPKASIAGAGNGSEGLIAFDSIEGLAFNPFSGDLLATHGRGPFQEDLLFKLNPATGAHVPGAFGGDDYIAVGSQAAYYHVADLAFDPTDGQLYILHWSLAGLWSLATLDPDTGATSTLGPAPGYLAGLAFDTAGALYATTATGSLENLYELDKSDASLLSSLVIDNGSEYGAMAISLSSLPNQAPVFDQNLLDRAEIEGSVVSLSAAATDPDGGDLVTYEATGLPPGLSIDTGSGLISGTISFAASTGSPYSVVITATDDGSPNLSTDDTFTWTVTEINRPPTFDQDLLDRSDAEGDAISISAAATDADGGDTITYGAGGLPAGLTIDTGSGLISGTIAFDASDSSPYSVTVTATDDGVPNESAVPDTFSWTVGNTNRPPTVTNPGPQTTPELDTFSLIVTATDPDGTVPTLGDGGTLPAWATLIDNGDGTAAIFGTPGGGASGTNTVTITASDGSLTGEITFDITVTNTNQAPTIANPGNQTTAEGATFNLTVTGSDPDGTIIGFSDPGTLPLWATLTDNGDDTATITGVPGFGDSGATTVTITASDGLLSAAAVFDITVTNTNRAPIVDPIVDATVTEATALTPVVVTATDPDGTTPSLAAIGLPGWATFTDNGDGTATITGTPGYNDAAASTVTINANDGTLTGSATFDLTVTNTNRPPIFDTDLGDRTDAEGASIALAAGATDLDGDSLSYAAAGLPPGLSINTASGDISGVITFDAAGAYTVEVTATDNGTPALGAIDSFVWSVSNINQKPKLDPIPDVVAAEQTTITFGVVVADPDGDDVAFALADAPAGAFIDPVTGVFTWTPGEVDGVGSYPVTVIATDDGSPALSDSAVVTITVTEVNRPPTILPLTDQHSDVGDVVSLIVTATDPDIPANGIFFAASGLPSGLSIDATTGLISGTIAADASGEHTVTILATDDGSPAATVAAPFTWIVGDTNQPPLVDPIAPILGTEKNSIRFAVTASDPDGDGLLFTMTGAPDGASIDRDTGAFAWTPTEGQGPGTYSFSVIARDNGDPQLGTARTVTISVAELNEPPTIEPITDRADNEGAYVVVVVSAVDGDVPINTLTYSATGLPEGIDIDPVTGVISGTIANSGEPVAHREVSVIVTDDGVPSQQETTRFTWTLIAAKTEPPNFAPSIEGIDDQYSEVGAVVGLQVTAHDAGAINYSAAGLPPGLSIHPDTGKITGSLGNAAIGTHDVVVTVADDGSPPMSSAISFSWTTIDRAAADDKVDIVVAMGDAPSLADEDPAPARPIRRGLVVMGSAAAATTESMQLPMLLLLALMAGFATVGRIGLYPLLIRGERHAGTITLYDEELGFGLVEPDGGGEQVFVHAHAFPRRQRAHLAAGTRLRYRLLASDNRASAWGATIEAHQ